MYIYDGIEYPTFKDVPLIKKDSALYNRFLRVAPMRCNRAKYMQMAYVSYKTKGAITLPKKDWWDYADRDKERVSDWLGINKWWDLNRSHIEAIKAVLTII